jgi:hypothetical protein
MAGQSSKAIKVKALLREEFRKNALETDPEKIEDLRNQAMLGLANYLTVESLSRLKRTVPTTSSITGAGPAADVASQNDFSAAMFGEAVPKSSDKQ